MRSLWRQRACWVPLVLFTALYASTYLYCFVLWHDTSTDNSVVACGGQIIISERLVSVSRAPMSTVTLARLIGKGQAGLIPQPKPYVSSRGIRIIPLFPFVAVSMLLPLIGARLYQRRCWWQHIDPVVPFLFLAIWMNGRSLRQLGERGFGYTLANCGTAIEAIGMLFCVPMSLAWLARLPRNVRDRRRRACAEENRCAVCGYLLKGLTETRCPECGTCFGQPGDRDKVTNE